MTVYNKITNSKKIQRYLAEIRGGEWYKQLNINVVIDISQRV
jgi:hypothetical protein